MSKTALTVVTLGFILGLTGHSTANVINDATAFTTPDIIYAGMCKEGEMMDEKTKKCIKK